MGAAPAHAARFPFTTDRAQGDTLYQQAFAAYQAGDYAQAQTLIEKADKFKPDQPDGWNLRGMVYLKQNAFNKAEAAFARAVVLDPKLWAAQFNLAEAPFQGKDYARARPRFEKLVDQTDHYKEAKKWELVQYKAFLCALLMGDDAGATKKLGKIPAKDGVTPANLYARAAWSFRHKDAAAARKTLAAAQTAYSPLLNDLFANSLVEAGWGEPTPPPLPPPTRTPQQPPTPMVASEQPLTPLAPLPPDSPRFADKYAPIVIDPKTESAAADPLPSGSTNVHPMLQKVTPLPPRPVQRIAPTPPPDDTPDHRGLLLE